MIGMGCAFVIFVIGSIYLMWYVYSTYARLINQTVKKNL